MPVNQAKVKSVLSGDTLILTAVNNPTQERTLSLAFVSAPRMKREGDEVGQRLSAIGSPLRKHLLNCSYSLCFTINTNNGHHSLLPSDPGIFSAV